MSPGTKSWFVGTVSFLGHPTEGLYAFSELIAQGPKPQPPTHTHKPAIRCWKFQPQRAQTHDGLPKPHTAPARSSQTSCRKKKQIRRKWLQHRLNLHSVRQDTQTTGGPSETKAKFPKRPGPALTSPPPPRDTEPPQAAPPTFLPTLQQCVTRFRNRAAESCTGQARTSLENDRAHCAAPHQLQHQSNQSRERHLLPAAGCHSGEPGACPLIPG